MRFGAFLLAAQFPDHDHTVVLDCTIRTNLPRWLRPGFRGYRRVDGRPHRPRDPGEYTELLCRLHPRHP
jgi:hypothetical protein